MLRSQTRSGFFSLEKWYLDCVDAQGNVIIGYSANLKWKKVALNYANLLLFDTAQGLESRTTLLPQDAPRMAGDLITWAPSRLKISGTWQRLDTPIDKTLLVSPQGSLRWLCPQPRALATIQPHPDVLRTGLGYIEKLEMNLAPWQLPFVELRWGRFLSAADTLIWIDWRGDTTTNWVFHQGAQVENALVSEDSVSFHSGKFVLRCNSPVVLREGPLFTTALSEIPGFRKIFPSGILNTYECKWRSQGCLIKPNGEVREGWVIHEVVKWKNESA